MVVPCKVPRGGPPWEGEGGPRGRDLSGSGYAEWLNNGIMLVF